MSSAAGVSVGTARMIGFLLAICGNTLIACSLTLQKSAHNSFNDSDSISDEETQAVQDIQDFEYQSESHPSTSTSTDTEPALTPTRSSLHFLQNPTWWIGTFLMAAGEVGNFAAFAFAPASLVAPLGAWSVVLSAVLAHVFLHEHVSNRNLLGIALCVTGAFLIGAAGPDVSAAEAAMDADAVFRLLMRPPFVVFIIITLSATAALIYISHRTTLGQQYVFVYVGVSSLLGCVTVVCAKALSTFLRLTIEGNSQFGNLLPFVLGVVLACAILAQLRYLNMAMSQFGNAQVIPVYYVLFTTCAMSSGVIMYREFDQLTLGNVPFFLGLCSTMSGVFFVSKSANAELEATNDLPGKSLSAGGKRNINGGYERMIPISPMSSPRSHPQPWP
eukprot:GFKZ01001238.1.p1 GENE.GFKZ01001238.1~~GFKZ01001238.1.p1  ORF type:complete len:388 (+),score=37.74 GFKZ01001238.1:440-1603(+)